MRSSSDVLKKPRSKRARLLVDRKLAHTKEMLARRRKKKLRESEGLDEGMTGVRQPAYEVNDVFIRKLMSSADMVKIKLTPLGRDELVMKLQTLGRKRRNPTVAAEVIKALRKDQDSLTVSRDAAKFIREELEHSLKLLSDPSFRSDPHFAYQKTAIEHSLKGIGASMQSRIRSILLEAQESVDEARQAVFVRSCLVMRGDKWRVIDKETGDLWPQTFENKDDAARALAAYQERRAAGL